MNPIVIVGAGITGCVIAHGLVRKGYKVVLIENEAQIGGLAKTFHYNGLSFDIGPHRFFTHKQQIYNFIKNILGDDYIIMPRQSEVYFLKRYHAWPLRPVALFNLPLTIVLKSAMDLVLMNIKSKKGKIDTFKDYILTHYGPSLYNVFFKDYTQKFLGISPERIHAEWAKEGMKRTIIDERMASRNLLDILKLFFNFKPPRTKFIYPREGIGVFCERLAGEIKKQGGEIRTHTDITHIRYSSGRIEEIFLKEFSVNPEFVIWTGSLDAICSLLGLACNGLKYLSLLAFNIEVNKIINKKFQWCYYGSRDIIFSRVTMPSSFSEYMAPAHSAGLCVEVTCHKGDASWNNPGLLSELVKKDLIKVGLIGCIEDIRNIYIEKIRDAYPIYTRNYQRDLEKTKDNLSKFKNLILAGRTGLFWYNNMDNSIENGLEVIKAVIQRV